MKKNLILFISIIISILCFLLGFTIYYYNAKISTNNKNLIMIYMCGSTLESKSAAATFNLEEILKADIPKTLPLLSVKLQESLSALLCLPNLSN